MPSVIGSTNRPETRRSQGLGSLIRGGYWLAPGIPEDRRWLILLAMSDHEPALQAEAGVFLVASPRLLDPNFMHAVVLLCEHGPQGSYGIIVNRPAAKRTSDLGSDAPLLEGRDDPLWVGGPVSHDTLQVLHRLGPDVPESHTVVPDVHLGGDQQVLRSALEGSEQADQDVRFLLGYSGWSANQLDGELAEGAWVICPATSSFVFDPDPETLWRRVLQARGGRFAHLAHIPPDPTWN